MKIEKTKSLLLVEIKFIGAGYTRDLHKSTFTKFE